MSINPEKSSGSCWQKIFRSIHLSFRHFTKAGITENVYQGRIQGVRPHPPSELISCIFLAIFTETLNCCLIRTPPSKIPGSVTDVYLSKFDLCIELWKNAYSTSESFPYSGIPLQESGDRKNFRPVSKMLVISLKSSIYRNFVKK